MADLDQYLAEKRIKHTWLAEKLAIPKSTLSNWVNGRANWPSHVKTKITELTGYKWPDDDDGTDLIDPRVTSTMVGDGMELVGVALRASRIPLTAIPLTTLGTLAHEAAQKVARGGNSEEIRREAVEMIRALVKAFEEADEPVVGLPNSQ